MKTGQHVCQVYAKSTPRAHTGNTAIHSNAQTGIYKQHSRTFQFRFLAFFFVFHHIGFGPWWQDTFQHLDLGLAESLFWKFNRKQNEQFTFCKGVAQKWHAFTVQHHHLVGFDHFARGGGNDDFTAVQMCQNKTKSGQRLKKKKQATTNQKSVHCSCSSPSAASTQTEQTKGATTTTTPCPPRPMPAPNTKNTKKKHPHHPPAHLLPPT